MTERTVWTGERIDDRMASMDVRFDRVDNELRELRREMQSGFDGIRSSLELQRVSFENGLDGLRADLNGLKRVLMQTCLGFIAAAVVAALAAVLGG